VCGNVGPSYFPTALAVAAGAAQESWFDTGPTYTHTHLVYPLLRVPLSYINTYTRGLALNCDHCTCVLRVVCDCYWRQVAVIMRPEGSAYMVTTSVYDEQPISRTYQYRKVRFDGNQ
jgi:hypothetical protein